MVKKQKGEKHRKGKSCKECMFSDYNCEYSVWYCEKYDVYPADFDFAADVCEGFCPQHIRMRGFNEEV